jgi:membrane fusion protein (multidrug efflux system)
LTDEAEKDQQRQSAPGPAEKSDSEEKKPTGNEKSDGKNEKPRSKLPIIIAAVLVVVAIIAGIIYWLLTLGEVTTDDAYTDGRAVSIATNTSGFVSALYVNDNQFVHRGDLLLIVDPRSNRAQLEQAEANFKLAQANLLSSQIDLQEEQVRAPAQLIQAQAQLAQARAQYADAERNYRRQLSVDQRATAQSDIDQTTQQLITAKAQVDQAAANVSIAALVQQNIASAALQVAQRQAQLAQARANLDNARTQLSYNYIRAPQDGWITLRNVELGAYLQASTQVFYIVTTQCWITANFKETQLNGMRVGQHVTISVDAFPALTLRGHVQSMQQGSGAVFSAFPAENATGNFVKIVRRVPVKILIDSGLPASLPILPLGISVEPTVHEP